MLPRLGALKERCDAILVDLDGTLLDGRSALTDRTGRAVRALVAAGLEVVICTGRSAVSTARIHRELGLDGPFVAFNGAWIGRPGEEPWRCSPIPDAMVPHVEGTERRAHFSFRHHGEMKYTLRTEHGEHERVTRWYEQVVAVDRPEALPCRRLMRVSLYFDGGPAPDLAWGELPDHAREVLHREQFPLRIFPEFPDSGLVLCEVQAKGLGKAEVFSWLAQARGIAAERTVAVGDQTNDLSMLSGAGTAVAMENAVPEVIALADHVIGHHAQEGFAAWVEAGAPLPPAP